MNESLDRLVERDHRAHEDREHHTEPGQPFAARRTEEESDPEGQRGQAVAEVVNKVGQKGDAARCDEDDRLDDRSDRQYEEAD
jgi:hypothetical protein